MTKDGELQEHKNGQRPLPLGAGSVGGKSMQGGKGRGDEAPQPVYRISGLLPSRWLVGKLNREPPWLSRNTNPRGG